MEGASLRLELFVRELGPSIEFYVRVLGFEQEAERPGGYTPLARGSARIALNLHSDLEASHPIRGVELVLEVDDVEAMYRHEVSERWPRAAELERQPWGLTDFRLVDPDGYYWRVTSRIEISRRSQ